MIETPRKVFPSLKISMLALFVVAFFSGTFGAGNSLAFAQKISNPEAFISFVETSLHSQKKGTTKNQAQHIAQFFTTRISFSKIVLNVLGSKARSLSKKDLDTLKNLSLRYLSGELEILLAGGFNPAEITIKPTGSKTKGTTSIVFSHFKVPSKNIDMQVDWRLKKTLKAPEGFFIEDLMVSGISYAQLLKAEMDGLLVKTKGDAPAAIKLLGARIDELLAESRKK